MFDFGALPPEINSGRMYAGPGSGPMMVAAAAWDVLAAELGTAASGYNSIIDELTNGPWVGPASTSMIAAVTPYVSWLTTIAGQAEKTAGQARAAAAAFEAAFAMTVPPPVIAANRVLLATLIATNFFGQNTPAIAATEAQYMEMWAQDAGAMYAYAASSMTASQMAPFAAPPQTTTPDGEAQQFAAVSQASTQQAGNTAQTAANTSSQLATPQLLSATTSQTTQQLTTAATAPTTTGTSLQDILPTPNTWWWKLGPGDYTAIIKQTLQAYFGVGIGNFGWSIGQQLTFGPGGGTAGAGGAWFPTPQFAQLGLGNLGNLGHTAGAVTAGAGQAAQVGGLSVPQQWATLASTVSPAEAAEAEGAPIQTVSASNPPGNALLRGMPTGAVGRRAGAAAGYSHKYGFRYSVLTRPPSAG
ncbi:PPE family protein [Mycobacterium paraseoulense]|uniref:PPE family protein n=2 Tax=Mycobacterium paraseoulense TaxID=590652 RepID=UPI00138D6FBA|nr:PPE family protein [Mycobacterium paraseoulense]BBZ69572.1 PPE family protein [Mycobacterium paraseoulense]